MVDRRFKPSSALVVPKASSAADFDGTKEGKERERRKKKVEGKRREEERREKREKIGQFGKPKSVPFLLPGYSQAFHQEPCLERLRQR